MAGQTLFAALGYMACSSLMLVVNKVAVHYLQAPNFVLLAQLFVSAAAVWIVGLLGFIKVDPLEWNKVKGFTGVAAVFVMTIFTNMKTLQYANVETFMVFRFSTPIAISICDYLFLGRELPSAKSWGCLAALLGGAVGYVLSDKDFVVTGYMWVGLWYFIFVLNQVYIKFVVDSVKMESNWGRVYYSNLLPCFPLAVGYYATNEQLSFTSNSTAALLVSCALGVGMSYFAFLARSLVSATYFAIIGNVCKVLTIIINVSIWDKHATPIGICWLLVCLVGTYFYEQAPMRKDKNLLPSKTLPRT
jgi:GDP-mannose transporter